MNDNIREEIYAELRRLGWSKAELARRMAKSPNYIYKMLACDDAPDQKGKIGSSWVRMLDYFGYELVIIKRNKSKK